MIRWLAVATLAASIGCLDVPSGPIQECHVNSDCGSGEVCSDGLCYGNPPKGTFAGTLSAPAALEDLVSTEIPELTLPADGWLGALQLDAPVTISGRVEAYCASAGSCSTTSVAAEVRLSRPSRFRGGPALRFSAESKANIGRGADSFSVRVPRTLPGDPPWTVTIDPVGGGDKPSPSGDTEPAELMPPRHLTLSATGNLEHQTYTLGGPDAPVITGSLKDALGQPLIGYRVVALGRWDDGSPLTEVSSVHFTSEGTYSITVAEEAIGPLELVLTPYGNNVVAPELHVTYVGDNSHVRNIAQPAGLGDPKVLAIPVQGLASDGEVKPVSGVRVIVRAILEPQFSGGARVELETEATTGEDGIAKISVLQGGLLDSMYRLRVVPPASSNFGIVFDGDIDVGKPKPDPVRLASRVAIRGTVLDSTGAPVPGVSVTARRSVRFLWSVDAREQSFLDEIPASTTLTPESGEFLVWVDPAVADVWGHYDLFFEPPAGSEAPNWSIPDIEIPRMSGQITLSLDSVSLPAAARLHGKIVSASGQIVEGSALRVFQISSNDHICAEVGFEPQDCTPASLVLGSAESDDKGAVRLNVPRP
jgi:hypothetical protein